MRKKNTRVWIGLLCGMLACGMLSACGDKHEHSAKKTDARQATCTENGNTEYYTCDGCNKVYSDADCTVEITLADTVVAALGHNATKQEMHQATCTENGNTEYYTCDGCNKTYSDADCTVEITLADTVLPYGHSVTFVSANDSTETEEGNVEHYFCSACTKYFEDEACTEELTEAEVIIAKKLPTLFNGEKEVYATDDTLQTGIQLRSYTLEEIYLNGEDICGCVSTDEEITLNETAVGMLKYGVNRLTVKDSNGASFAMVIYYGVTPGQIVYYDFDTISFEPRGSYVIGGTVEKGIDGNSLHIQKGSDGGMLFGFGGDASTGYAPFAFTVGQEYKLSFDIKVLNATSSDWWSPLRFGDNGDVLFFYDDGSWLMPDNNTLFSQGTVQVNEDGSYRVTAIFKAGANCTALDLPNWGGGVDVLLDNVCLEVLNPNIVRIACVGDSITESSNPEISYPEKLQMLLGYESYYVFNFGKSGANVLAEGALPYSTWAAWQYNTLQAWNPDVIFTMLGTNDGRPDSGISVYKDQTFIDDYREYISLFKSLAERVYVLISPYAFGDAYGISASLVNDHIINVEGYIAYLENLPVIDVHSAIKGLDRVTYFPDYIHGNNAGYAKIAEAVYDGFINGHTAGKYALAYALKVASDKTSTAYNNANAIYNNPNATQEEIDAAFEAIKDTMEIPANYDSNVVGLTDIYTQVNTDITLPVKLRKNTVVSLTVNGTVLDATAYTATADGIVIRANSVAEKGVYGIQVVTSDAKTFKFVVYYGYEAGQIHFIDSDYSVYTNADNNLFIPTTVTSGIAGFEGNCLHFYGANGTMFGYDANAAFGMVDFDFKGNTTYTFSFDYKVGPDWNKDGGAASTFTPIWFGAGKGDVIYWYNDLHTLNGNLAISSSVTCIDEVNGIYRFSVTFKTPATSFSTMEIAGWLTFFDLYVDNITLEQVS